MTIKVNVVSEEKSESSIETKEIPQRINSACPVYLRTTIFSIREIDIIEQTFTADVYLEATLKKEIYKNLNYEELTSTVHKDIFLNYVNRVSDEKSEYWVKKSLDIEDEVHYKTRFLGKFSQKFDLKMFPFDSQPLNIIVSSYRTSDIIEFLSVNPKLNLLCPGRDSFTLTDWKLHDNIELNETQSDPSDSSSNMVYPVYEFKISVSREYSFYIYNIISIMFALVTMSGVSFAIPYDDIGDRLSVVVTLILTAVAFKFTITTVPRISYLTFLDSYMFCCFGFLSLVLLENAVIFKIDDDRKDRAEFIFILVILCCWIIFNTIEIIRAVNHIRSCNPKYKKS